MKKVKIATLAALATVVLSGCGEEEVKTESYYVEHKAERIEKVSWCKESADRRKTVNCQNAINANEGEKLKEFLGG